MPKKILVTGSSGTIGTRLCETLLEQGFDVTGVDNRPNKWSEKVNSITTIADLRSPDQLASLPSGFDIVIHLAANARVYDLVVDPRRALDNLITTFNALEFARNESAKAFIFASSRETYGNSRKTIHKETDARIENCESPYTASKVGGEALVHAYGRCYGLTYAILRFSNVYGMYDDSDRVVPVFFRRAKAGESLTVFGKEKELDFTYIDDTVSGIIATAKKIGEVNGKTLNIAHGKGTALTALAKKIQLLTKSPSDIVIEKSRTGEVIKYVADISLAKKLLGYKPSVGIDEGLRLSLGWYSKNQ